jgi:hypothetical protein
MAKYVTVQTSPTFSSLVHPGYYVFIIEQGNYGKKNKLSSSQEVIICLIFLQFCLVGGGGSGAVVLSGFYPTQLITFCEDNHVAHPSIISLFC